MQQRENANRSAGDTMGNAALRLLENSDTLSLFYSGWPAEDKLEGSDDARYHRSSGTGLAV